MEKYYSAVHFDKEVRENSSSGGVFTAISDQFLNSYSVIYGCIMNGNLRAQHIRANCVEDRNKMRGSKYIQSDMSTIYGQVEQDLKKDMNVLFTGTPCQVVALTKYMKLKKTNIDKLLTVDFVCHGVGSPLFFGGYIGHLEKKYSSTANYCSFRAKNGYMQKQDMEVGFENGKRYMATTTKYDWFYSVYLKNLIQRPSCYECKFAKNNHYSDIVIADLWGKKEATAKSLVIVKTKKGEKYIDKAKKDIEFVELNDFKQSKSTVKPDNREEFWDVYRRKGYIEAQRYIGNGSLKKKLFIGGLSMLNKMRLLDVTRKLLFKVKR